MTLKVIKVDEAYIRLMDEYRQTVTGKSLLEQSRDNPVIFAEKMLGIRLYSWQVDFITRIVKAINNNYWTKEFLALTSRQIGKSLCLSIIAIWCCVFNKYPGTIHNNTIVGVVSATDVQAKKLLHEMKKLIMAGDRFMLEEYKDSKGNSIFGEKFFSKLLDDKEPNNTTTMSFKAYNERIHGLLLKDSKVGSVIKSYPPTPSVLGETFTIVMEDEAGMSDMIDDQFHYEYIYPTGNSTNAIRIYTSTPWMPSGFFYRLADPEDEFPDHPADRLVFDIDAIKIEAPNMYATIMEKTIKQMNRDGKTDEVQRAYYCRFVKGEKSFFDSNDVFKSFSKDYTMLQSYRGECDMGIDYGGQVVSKTVITITRITDKGRIQRLYHRVYPVGKDLSLLEDIEILLQDFNVQRIIPDDCPAGDFLNRIMVEKGWNVQPMNFKADKVKKYGAFRAALKKGIIESYEDADLKTEMVALEQIEGQQTSKIQHAPGYTDDMIDSFVMSTYFYVQDDEGAFGFIDAETDSTGYGLDEEVRYYDSKI